MPIDALPDELLAACCAALSVSTSVRAMGFSTRWRQVVNSVWRARCTRRWPSTAHVGVLNYVKFYVQRQRKLPPFAKKDYMLLLDGTLNGSNFSVSLPLVEAAADGGVLTWACAALTWQTGTVPVFVLKSIALWRESTQQLAQLDGAGVGGTAGIKEEERDEEVWEEWRDGTIKPYNLFYADFGIDDFVNETPVAWHHPAVRKFAWRLRYMNGSVVFALVDCIFGDDEPWQLEGVDVDEAQLAPFIEPVSEEVFLQGLSLACA